MKRTPSQERALDRIRHAAHDKLTHGGGGRIERFEIEMMDWGALSVYVKVRPTPEGTVGALFPYYAHFFVGRRGGIEIPGVEDRYKGEVTRARKYPLIYGFRS